LIAFALMLVAIFLRVPIGVAMAVTGLSARGSCSGAPPRRSAQLKTLTYDTFKNYNLSIVPLFLLMGQFATKSGMSGALFQAASDWLGHRKGGVAMAAVGACAGFGAVCGSSLATASTMGQVALPEMRKRGYSDSAVDRGAGGGRHAGHPDPAVDHPGDLRDPGAAEHREDVRGGPGARDPGRARATC
jgi:TRAP-type mannitol/chloroaromatic compound transport system permease large subunit